MEKIEHYWLLWVTDVITQYWQNITLVVTWNNWRNNKRLKTYNCVVTMDNWRNNKILKEKHNISCHYVITQYWRTKTIVVTMSNWHNYKDRKKTLLVTMGNWRNCKRLKQWNIIGHYG